MAYRIEVRTNDGLSSVPCWTPIAVGRRALTWDSYEEAERAMLRLYGEVVHPDSVRVAPARSLS